MMSFTQLSSSDASTSNKLWEFIVIITHFTVCLVIKTHILVKPYLTAGSTLVKGMNHSSFQPLILYLICLSGDMSLPSTHADCVSSQLTQTRDLYFFFLNSPNYAWENGGERACRFTYLFLPERQTSSLECQCAAQQPLTDVRSQWWLHTVVQRTHTYRLCQWVR